MNRVEHLLECLSEECSEVGQRVSKALRFGLGEVQAGQPLTNAERVVVELKDLLAVVEILVDESIIPHPMVTPVEVDAKRDKIERFMAIAREQGVLTP
ncbi:MAG TPA: hypothetical protein VN231_05970 [Allosphingosinicella sp.]|nr:hypothetical protein [Allosphingosinicella sp.]